MEVNRMDVKPQIELDMTKYGGKGIIALSLPTARNQVWMRNLIGNDVDLTNADRAKPQNVGDIELVYVLAHIKSAPFAQRSIDAFYDYCDVLDEAQYGASAQMYQDMIQAVSQLGDASPLDS